MASNSHQNTKVKMMSVDGHVSIFSVEMENSERCEEKRERKKEEDRTCVICLEERKLTVREWTKKDGTLARQFVRARTHKLFCCSGWCHDTCLKRWVEENGRLLLLFKCPHCRALGCDFDEMQEFQEGEL